MATPPSPKNWIGFTAMAVGMFMAILDTQIVASSLPEIQVGLGIARPIELGADRVSDGGDRRDPADRLADLDAVDPRRLCRLRWRLYRGEPRLRRRDRVLGADPGAYSCKHFAAAP